MGGGIFFCRSADEIKIENEIERSLFFSVEDGLKMNAPEFCGTLVFA